MSKFNFTHANKFDITQWGDFVRGVADPEAEETMREQLASDPGASRGAVEALRQVAAVGRWDAEHPVPDHAVRIAKAIGSLRRRGAPEPSVERVSILRRLPFAVAFDSLLQPAVAGTRDLQTLHRQLVFEAEGYSVDVRMEHELEPPSAVVVGQVLSREDEARPVEGMPVLLVSDQQVVGRTVTGTYGEFQAEGLPRDPLSLYLLAGSEECLELPVALDSFNGPPSGGTDQLSPPGGS